MYWFLDIFFVVFHTVLIFFNLFGWIWEKTRKLNLFTLLITAVSWFVIGIFYGMGYCFLTDWHYKVLIKSGETGMPSSYISYLTERISGQSIDSKLIDILTVTAFLIALGISLLLNIKDYKFSRKHQE